MAAGRLLLLPLFLLTLSFSPLPSSSLPEVDALLKLKESFTNSGSLSSWNPSSPPCSWQGVMCVRNTSIIIGLHLSDMGLGGKIDVDALTQIPSLRTLSFVNNNFDGPMPEFHKLGALKALLLTGNQFSGTIEPDFFTNLDSLKKVYLSRNRFSGNLPQSLTGLQYLKELNVQNNEFSGNIPPFTQSLIFVDFSNNKLEGQIPDSLANFSANAFAGNEMLCGKPMDKECDGTPTNPWGSKVISIIIGVIIVGGILFLVRASKTRRGDDDFSVLSREQSEQPVRVHVPSSNHSRASESSKKGGESKKGSSRNGMGDLVMVYDEKGVFGLADLMKAAAEVLGNGGMGSAYKAAMANGLSVVVKRIREMNRIGRDAFHAEMKRFGKLRHPNILTPLAYHYRREEKLLISEYMPKGSLLYVLHGDRGTSHAELNWPTRLKIVQGIASGLGFLHSELASHDLPHGNLKSSNVLLSNSYEPQLNDYALHPLVNPNTAVQSLFALKTPDYIQYQQVSHKTDVYCLGIIILEIITGKFPSQYHSNGKGGTDVVQWVLTAISERRETEVIDPEIKSNTNSLNQMLQLLQIGASCTESNPDQRLNLREAIRRIEEVQVK